MRALALLLLCAVATAGDYGALLARVVKRDGVDYVTLKRERAELDAFVASLAAADPGRTDAARIAFWINAYNALTLQQVLDTRPEKGAYSVKKVPEFWTGRKWNVAGRSLTLDAIEHQVLRKEFKEPRIHFALNCASRSCPALARELYRGSTLDQVLSEQTRAFLADREKNTFNEARKTAAVSQLFRWYGEDFGPLLGFLTRYAPKASIQRSMKASRWRISYLPYDWSLNEADAAPQARDGGSPVILVLYGLAALGLLAYGFHAFKLLGWRAKHGATYREELRSASERSPLGRTLFPRVLVQVPVYNEPAVVVRVIEAVAALDYPRDRLEIQVLDDSTDETVALVDRAAARHGITVLRRGHRAGFKAGALAEGLARSDAEYVAIFDADFKPGPDFLLRALPLFDAPGRVACVQGRWEHLNRGQNLLTRAQAVGVDAHFHVQQFARAAAGRFINFNGTAGVWRRAAIEDAGGWRGDTLTEDLDLSYRAQLRGWRIVVDSDLAVPAELPPTLEGYKSQQRRWACGSMQCARKFLGAVWSSKLPLGVKTEATFHLCGYGVCVAMVMIAVLLPFGVGHLPMLHRIPGWWPLFALLWSAALGPIIVATAGQVIRGRVRASDVALCFFVGLGSCANNAVAVVRGLVRPIRTFVRTPKQGSRAALRSQAPRLEQAMALFSLGTVLWLARSAPWAVAGYALFCATGFLFLAVYGWLAESA